MIKEMSLFQHFVLALVVAIIFGVCWVGLALVGYWLYLI